MVDILKQYVAKRLDLAKMVATEKTSVTVGSITFGILAFFVILFFIILLNIGLGLLIGHYLENYGLGILIIAGFYLLLTIILFIARKTIKTMVANKIIKAINN